MIFLILWWWIKYDEIKTNLTLNFNIWLWTWKFNFEFQFCKKFFKLISDFLLDHWFKDILNNLAITKFSFTFFYNKIKKDFKK